MQMQAHAQTSRASRALLPTSTRALGARLGLRSQSVKLSATAAPSSSVSPRQLADLQSWLGNQKGTQSLDKVIVESRLDTGAAILVASKDIGAGETIFAVADNQWLSPQAVSRTALGPYVRDLEPWVQLALLLIQERFVGASSTWGAYVGSLPAMPTSPLFWSQEQLNMLQGTQLVENLQAYR